jgi:hypothetical protein
VESLLSRLIQTAHGDINIAQGGIVYIDEIDKIRAGGSGFKNMRLVPAITDRTTGLLGPLAVPEKLYWDEGRKRRKPRRANVRP